MKYHIRPSGDVLVIELSGPTWGTLAETQLKPEVSVALGMGRRRFVIDFTSVSFITSMGLGVIVACWVSIGQAGGALRVCGLSPRVLALFAVSGVDKVLEIHPDLPSALSGF